MRLTEGGAAATAGCIGVCIATILALLTLSAIRPSHVVALVAFSVSIPMLCGALTHHLRPQKPNTKLQEKDKNLFIALTVVGPIGTFIGLTAVIAALSYLASIVFVVVSAVVLVFILEKMG